MEQDNPSFWADIKKYEDTLERDPNSYCFAPLSELYRKLGMVDDAINVAKRGCELHPEYVGGYMALGRAYHEKGMREECRSALEKVVRVTPDNLLAQRILSQLYIDAGEIAAAENALNAILAQNPDDVESRMLLDSMARVAEVDKKSGTDVKKSSEEINMATVAETGGEIRDSAKDGPVETNSLQFEFVPVEDDEEILDLLESDIIEESISEAGETEEIPFQETGEIPFQAESCESVSDVAVFEESERKDPLTTVTIAELYVSQGFPERALDIYRELLATDPGNEDLKSRLTAVESEINKHVAVPPEDLGKPELPPPIPEPPVTEALSFEPLKMEPEVRTSVDESPAGGDQYPAGSEEHVIHALEMWLENIKRRR